VLLRPQHITISRPSPKAPISAELARPGQAKGPFPGMVVLHDMLGDTRDLSNIVRRFAAHGYLTVAPSLYSDGPVRCVKSLFRAMLTGQGSTFDDIDTVRRWLLSQGDASGRVGVVGFCMGGGFALLCATRGFHASAPNYPYAPGNLEKLLQGACPIVASYGGRDPLPHVTSRAPTLRRVLERARVPHDVVEYPEARHAFINHHDLAPLTELARMAGFEYHAPSAEHAWGRMLAFFARHLGPGSAHQAPLARPS
jgi:carboxymethylenebutenolidase